MTYLIITVNRYVLSILHVLGLWGTGERLGRVGLRVLGLWDAGERFGRVGNFLGHDTQVWVVDERRCGG